MNNKTITNFANNQVLISFKDKKTGAFNGNTEFWSYGVLIAQNKDGKIYLDSKKWDYSRTTIKYLCEYLGYSGKKIILEGIKNNIFTLKNLNK